MIFWKSIRIALLLLSVRCLSAQDYQAEILHYGVENGLSHREVEVVFQDRDGFIWLGTRFGLNRFDGYTFQSWTRPQYGLNFNDISRIFQDDAGWLWLYNSDRVFIFLHPHTSELRTTEQQFGSALPFKTSPNNWQYDPRSPAADSMGRLHFITHDPDLEFIYTSKAGFQQQARPFTSISIDNNLRTLYNPARQSTWELQADGWHIFDRAHRLQLVLLRTEQPADLFTPNCMYADHQGRVWLGGDFGLTMIDVQPVHFQRYFSFSGSQQKPFNNSARGIWADEQSIYANFEMGGWVKIARHPSPSAPPWTLLNRTKDVPDRFLPGLYGYWGRPLQRDANGHFWIGADHSLRQLDSTGRLINKFTFEQEPAADFWCIHPEPNGRLWLGYAKGLAYKDPTDRYIRRLAGLPGMDTFPSTLVLNMVEDRENQLWLCTNRGLYCMNTTNKTAIRYSSRDTGRCWLPADDFQHLHQDKEGVYWLATAGQGLIRWDRQTGQIQRITQAKGLSSDNIYAVYEDSAQRLWMSSDYGIMQLDKSSLRVRIYLPKDGLAQEEFNRIAHFQAADGTIFMGGLNGITAFNPQDFYRTNATAAAAPLCITSLKQFNRKRELIDRTGELWQNAVIIIAPEEEFFQLEFVLLAFENIEKIRYAWKVEGVDADWNYQAERSIRLSRLPFGTHTLRIKAQLANGQPAANELTFTIVVLRPFYLSFWFFTLLTILLMFGSYSWYAWRLRRLRQRQQDLEAAIQLATAQIQQDKTLIEQQANELRQLDQMKSRFFANVSHELRTPLTLILGPIGTVLNSEGLTGTQINLLQKTRESGRALLKLVNNLLDLAKMEQDKLSLQVTPEQLYSLLQNVLTPYENYAQQLDIQLILDYQTNPDLQVAIDRDKLETILNNLISNALKFTLSGGTITLRAEDRDPVMWLLVQDTGLGIHPDDLPHIFKRFYQSPVRPAQSSSDYLAGGTGIGLALSQELAQALGGRLWAESIVGQGSTFYLEFPKQEVNSLVITQVEPVQTTNLPFKSTKLPVNSFVKEQNTARLLLVEDNGDLRDYLFTILSPYYEVVTAVHGQAALNILAQVIDFQLIVSDIMMPVMDGFQLIEKLKAQEPYRHIPIIMLTARAELEDKLRALRIGVDDYLLKPFEEAELLARIENLLAHARQRTTFQQTASDPETLPATSPTISVADQHWLERLEQTIRQHLADPQFNTEFVAEKMAISRRQLQRRLQQLVGLSPHAYIQEIRLHEARHLLEKRAFASVKEVAKALGYPNTEYFSRQFRGRFGKLPSEYLG